MRGKSVRRKAKPASPAGARAKVEAFVRKQSPAHQLTINRLRAIVKGAVPGSTSG